MTAPSGLPNVSKEIYEKKLEHVNIITWLGAYWTLDNVRGYVPENVPPTFCMAHEDNWVEIRGEVRRWRN